MLLCLYIHHIIEIKIYGFKINTAIYTSKNKIWDIFKKNKHFNNYIFHKKTSGKVLGTLYFFTKKMTCNYMRCLATYKKVNLNLVAENCQT